MTTTTTQLNVHRGEDRGTTELDWLHSRHSFSFGDYHDPARMGFRRLRVLNDDVIEPGGGFGEHPHRDMEIISWMLDGALRHRDDTGNSGVIRPGDAQVMTAGRGIRHSEFNASTSHPAHLIQIWIEPLKRGLDPHYEQRNFPVEKRRNAWQLIATGGEPIDQAMRIHQDADVSVCDIEPGHVVGATINDGRFGYLHVARGEIDVNGQVALRAGDALEITGPADLEITGKELSELLLFDLA